MEAFIVIVIMSLAIFIIFKSIGVIRRQKQDKKDAIKSFQNISDFKATKQYQNSRRGSTIAFDENIKEVLIMDRKYFSNIKDIMEYKKTTGHDQHQLTTTRIKFSDILKSEIKTDDVTISAKSTSRTVGGALIGGVLAGGAGAIIGGLSGGGKNLAKIKSIDLVLTTKTLSNPIVKFRFFDSFEDSMKTQKETPASDLRVKSAFEKSEEWQSIMTIIIDQEDKQNH